jgi:hypothetical protein
MPFWGDQALFTIYGRELARGAVLYRDVFDVKQPGIFVFYALGGSLFGFTEVGIHLFELVYWLAFSVFALKALPPYFATRWGAALVPLLTVVVYYLHAGLLDLTQIEILVAFPILVAWWLVDRARPGTRAGVRRFAAAGLVAAAVVLLKYVYVLVVVGFVVYALVRARRDGVTGRDLRRCIVAFAIALAVPLVVTAAYFAAFGQLGRIWWAYFELSPTSQLGGPRPISYLVTGARRFLIGHGPALILAVLGSIETLRERARPRLDIVIGAVIWLTAGGIAFLIQGWPEYKWSLFTAPVGILAVVGLETLVGMTRSRIPRARWILLWAGVVVALVIAAAGPPPELQTQLLSSVVIGCAAAIGAVLLARGARGGGWTLGVLSVSLAVSVGLIAVVPLDKLERLAEHDFASTVQAREELRRSWTGSYAAADADLEVLRDRGMLPPGPFYVFGDPVLLLRAHRSQAVPILGWGPEFLDLRAWRELHAGLRSSSPPYIVVDDYARSLIRSRYPPILRFIGSRYEVALVGQSGTWYRRS